MLKFVIYYNLLFNYDSYTVYYFQRHIYEKFMNTRENN